MACNLLNDMEIKIPTDIKIKAGNAFTVDNVEYIIMSVTDGAYGEINVLPMDEYIKRYHKEEPRLTKEEKLIKFADDLAEYYCESEEEREKLKQEFRKILQEG